MTRRNVLKLGAFTILGVGLTSLSNFLAPAQIFADTFYTLDGKLESIPRDLTLRFTRNNAEVTWYGVKGSFIPSTTYPNTNVLAVPTLNTAGNFRYKDFCDIKFLNAGTFNDRSIDMTIHFDELYVSSVGTGIGGATHITAFAQVGETDIGLGGCLPWVPGFRYVNYYTFHATWSDNGEPADLPFAVLVQDIDNFSANYFEEAWTAISGFTGDFYMFPENSLKISGNRFSSAHIANFDGIDSIRKAGVYAMTTGGTFSCSYEHINDAASLVNIFLPLSAIPKPNKSFHLQG